MGQVSPWCVAGHPAPSQCPDWICWSGPQAFASSCKHRYEENWEHWEPGRLLTPELLLQGRCEAMFVTRHVPGVLLGWVKADLGAAGMPSPQLASRSLALAGFGPVLRRTRALHQHPGNHKSDAGAVW